MTVVSQRERKLKWRGLDWLEALLSVVCGLLLAVFTFATLANVIGRILNRPILWIDELIIGAFIWGIFLGAAVAVRRSDHFRVASFVDALPRYWRLAFETVIQLVVLGCALSVVVFGYDNFLQGFRNYLETTGTPIAVITASVPVFGALTLIFSAERLVNIWRVVLASDYQPEDFSDLDLKNEEGSI